MLSSTFLICYVFLVGRNVAVPTGIQQRTPMIKTRLDDLDGSATGYTYNQQQGVPVYYVQYTNQGSGQHYYTPDAVHYVLQPGVAPVASAVSETTPILRPYATVVDTPRAGKQIHEVTADYGDVRPLKHAAEHARPQPYAPYYLSETAERQKQKKEKTDDEDVEHKDRHHEKEQDDNEDDHEGNGEVHGDSDDGVSNHDGERSFEAEEGEKKEAEKHSDHAEKDKSDYKKSEEHSKTEHSKNNDGKETGYYDTKDEHKKEHVDDARKHGSHEESEKSGKSNDYGRSSSYKKGYKTSGYHNVFHKDEYKNETDFYDEDHEKGHFDKHEEFDKGYKVADGDSKKGGHHSSEKDHKDRGKKGWYKKEHRDDEDRGHQAEGGEESYFDNHENHDAEEDSELNKTYKSHKDSKP